MSAATIPSTLSLDGISHRYGAGRLVLDTVDLSIRRGETVALMGPSGSGKTTLLTIIGLLVKPTRGTVSLDHEIAPTSERVRVRLRTALYAWVFQTVNVLGTRTAEENVALALLARGTRRAEASERAGEALAQVGLDRRLGDRVADLSGGELQRVCIARALVVKPPFVLADEPTGQLDHATSASVLDAMWAALGQESALIVATHDPYVAARCGRVIEIVDGRLSER